MNKLEPRVSVVMPSFNTAKFIGPAIESVLAQDYGQFELIVVDDGSSDGTPDIAEAFTDSRIRVHRCSHRGPTHAMNLALDLAQGTWVAFLDADDLWAPGKLRRHVEVMTARPGLDITFCRSRMIDGQGRPLPITSPYWSGYLTYRDLLISNPAANGSSIVADRQALIRAGGFDTAFNAVYDQDLWLRVALQRQNNIASIPEQLTFYRRRSAQITSDPSVMEHGWEKLIEKHRELSPETVSEVEGKSRSNLYRYLAAIAYEQGDSRNGLQYLGISLRSAPLQFLRKWRSYLVAAALMGLAIRQAMPGKAGK